MQPQLYQAGIVLLAVIVGLIAGAWMTVFWHNWRSNRFRAQHDIPDIIGTWRCQWFDDTLDTNRPKVEDTLKIHKWTSNGEFLARGYQPQFHLSYPIVGDVDPSRVVTLVYKA